MDTGFVLFTNLKISKFMQKYDSIIFDIDGTLWNASKASSNGWNVYLTKKGYHATVKKEDIESVAGCIFEECVKKLLAHINEPLPSLLKNLNHHETEAVKSEGGVFYNKVKELMPRLANKYKLYLVSNCQEWYMNVFFEKSNFKNLFADWDCHGRLKRSKADNIKDIIKRNNLQNPVYIGDTMIDKNASSEAGIDFIHARYGHQKIESEMAFNSFEELAHYLLCQ